MLSVIHEVGFSAVSESKRLLVCAVVGIDVQVIVSGRPYPFGRHTEILVVLAVASSEIPLNIVSELHVRRVG